MEKASIAKNKFFLMAIIIAILNPVFSGLILGFLMLSEPDLKREGRVVLLFSVVWSAIALLLFAKFRHLLTI